MSDAAANTQDLFATDSWFMIGKSHYDIWGTKPGTPLTTPETTFHQSDSAPSISLSHGAATRAGETYTLSFDVMSTEQMSAIRYPAAMLKWNNELVAPVYTTQTGVWEHLTFNVIGTGKVDHLEIIEPTSRETGNNDQ